jgi:ubiquitin C-terminal hydrolase
MLKRSKDKFRFITLENCFEYYQKKEYLSNENQIYCNNCHVLSNATSRIKLLTCPQVMTVILNRGKGLEFDAKFQYPPYINIDKYIITKASYGATYKYELICVIKIKDLINNLKREDKKIPENFSLYFQTENDLIELEKDKTIGDYDIQNGNKLTII